MFLMPNHPPERSMYDATQWDLRMIEEADKLGYTECWIGEHFTVPWEPIPSPDLLIAQALLRTKNIKLAPGAHLLPYHNPVELAHRVAYLDHLAQGRFMLGIGAGGTVTDWELFNVDGKAGENRKMMAEAFELMLKLWTEDEPFQFRGKYFSANYIAPRPGDKLKMHIKPFQKPFPPIGITGFTESSPTLKMAGAKGLIPMSLGWNKEYIASHWTAVTEGAKSAGRVADRGNWRITQDIFVAKTDEEAMKWALEGFMGRFFREYWIPLFAEQGDLKNLKPDPSLADELITPEYLAKTSWLVGSPETVTKKLQALYDTVGGFGTLLLTGYDYSDNPEPWLESMRLLAEEVIPRIETKVLNAN
jgi:alkanesulfonate monooxygenase SsuD/methylene tetrahydromethanopterin reductase-like flavin-dependent oxidoreductase (luciferase family)